MEKHWLRHEGAGRVAVFVLGWAADSAVVEHVKPRDCDVLCICDLRDLAPLAPDELATYREKYLFAWSFGVLAAEVLFPDMEFTRAVALNGTPLPLDDRFGIGRRRFDLTMAGLAGGGMELFERRAYGEHYERLKERLSPRGLQENIRELEELQRLALSSPRLSVKWDKAVVGSNDVIFPPRNMLAYWADRAELLPLSHYPFADADIILREIDHR